jgi:hypothetical protein
LGDWSELVFWLMLWAALAILASRQLPALIKAKR